MKKLIKVIIAVLLIINSSVSNVFADDSVYTEGDFNYVIDDEGSIKITYYFGNDEVVEVPRFIGLQQASNDEYVPRYVTTIAASTFVDSDVKKVILPDTVVYIEQGALDGIEVEYRNSEGETVEKEVVTPIIIKPTENTNQDIIPNNQTQNETVDSIEFEEITNEFDTETGEEKVIFEITDEKNSENIANNETTVDTISDTTTTPPSTVKYSFNIFGVIFVATAIFAIIYYYIQFKKK